MNVAIVGASGFVGTKLLTEALKRGHEVTAIVRNPDKITISHPKLTVTAIDVFDEAALTAALSGHDAVLSAYNAGWDNPNLYDDFIKASQHIEKATQQAGVQRLLVVGGAGSLEVAPGVQLVDTPQFPAEWKAGATAARDYLNLLRQNQELDWTFLSPAILLQPGERTGVFRVGTDQPVFNERGECAISVDDLAVALLNEVENPQFIRQRFTVGY
ncbi:NAD(P)-dependent oxidoreductase [Spirosoma soli]|uniref:NAD(P)-dependent oxidoreductase n=1 Tax=Spirosoma soli TaxID=1770529 RepID=A0ABW5M192_9BACT